ncbi:hypothetical protein TNCV_4171731 [Trichonephila clavipes]|nr:hypothetical protein TNCV_4171731 [Trichonephila clavipes]
MDDNAPCHRTVAAEQLLESRRLAARTLPPVTIRELLLALQDEWAAMPQQLMDTLILSMGRRSETCLAVSSPEVPSTLRRAKSMISHTLTNVRLRRKTPGTFGSYGKSSPLCPIGT